MKKTRKLITLILAGALSISMLAGCSGNGTPDSGKYNRVNNGLKAKGGVPDEIKKSLATSVIPSCGYHLFHRLRWR